MATVAPARWLQVKEIFQQVAELPLAERPAYLAQACQGDETLRTEIERLLAADEQAAAFLEHSPLKELQEAELAAAYAADQLAGQMIGQYRLRREIGRGGMGTVYLAQRDDQQFQQQVAIKIIRRGMDTDDILRRFRTERQILARLNHPNIARLLDGGSTADGQPYYVMEFIEGQFIDEYCQTQRLPLTERVRLFRQVCAAVHYAHQHLVIHRDLKPSNILVTANGEVKLLDFGIAKLLSPETDNSRATLTGLGLMTPAYASPEQLRGAAVTTAADVYALGVILYELLTETRPYQLDQTRPEQFAQIICATEPPRPSSQKRLRDEIGSLKAGFFSIAQPATRRLPPADLDNIVLMALRKEPKRRYASAEQLAEDLRRAQEGLPISARPDTWRYRTTKFVQRNKTLTLATLLVLFSLLGGMFATARQARIAEHERALAQRRFVEVRTLANAFVFKYHDEIAKLPGSTGLREMMMSDARNYLTRLAAEAQGDTALQLELAQAWLRLGDVLGKPYLSNLGQTDEAVKSYQQAVTLARGAFKAQPNNNEAQRLLGLSLLNSGQAETRAGRTSTALQNLQEAVQVLETSDSGNANDQEAARTLANVHIALGDTLMRQASLANKAAQAVGHFRHAQEIMETLVQVAPTEIRLRRILAIAHQRLGLTLHLVPANDNTTNPLAEALAHHQRSTELFEQIAAAEPSNLQHQRDLVDQYTMKAELQAQAGDAPGALADCRKGIELFTRLVAADPQNAEAKRDLAIAHYITSNLLKGMGQCPAAIQEMQQALALLEELVKRDPHNSENLGDLVSGFGRLHDAYLANHQPRLAHAAQRSAADYQRRWQVRQQ